MYDDNDLDYTYAPEYTYDLDETYDMWVQSYAHANTHLDLEEDLDEEYTRDSHDYNELAYRHYAWYNKHTSHEIHMYAHKRIVSVTLDIECYDDLELENLDWREVLDLQGDENVHVNIKELADIY